MVASKKVRPGSVYMLQVTLMALYHKEVYVRAMLSREGEEYSSKIIHFIEPGTKPMELDVSSSSFCFIVYRRWKLQKIIQKVTKVTSFLS